MQAPSFLRGDRPTAANLYLDTHPIGEILRSLFLSSLLWIGLAIILYTVYSMVAGTL